MPECSSSRRRWRFPAAISVAGIAAAIAIGGAGTAFGGGPNDPVAISDAPGTFEVHVDGRTVQIPNAIERDIDVATVSPVGSTEHFSVLRASAREPGMECALYAPTGIAGNPVARFDISLGCWSERAEQRTHITSSGNPDAGWPTVIYVDNAQATRIAVDGKPIPITRGALAEFVGSACGKHSLDVTMRDGTRETHTVSYPDTRGGATGCRQ